MFSVPTLTIGDVQVVLHPVASAEQLHDLVAVISSIRGIDRAVVNRLRGREASIAVHASQPVSLAGELRERLRSRIVTCKTGDGQIRIQLTSTTASRPTGGQGFQTPTAAPIAGEAFVDDIPASSSEVAAVAAINEFSDVSVLLFDHQQRFTAAAGGLHRRFGHEFALMQGRTAREIARPEVWGLLRPGFEDALKGAERTMDVPMPDDQGVYEAWFRPLVSDDAIVGGMITIRDVTGHRTTELALTEAFAVFRATFDDSFSPSGLLTTDGRWARCNSAMQDLMGADESALASSSIFDRVHPDDIAMVNSTLQQLIAGRDAHELIRPRLRVARGAWLQTKLRLVPIGTDTGLRGIVVEIDPTHLRSINP